MKAIKGLRIVALAGLIVFVSQLGHVAHAGFFGGLGDVIGTTVDTIAEDATSSDTSCTGGGLLGSTLCAERAIIENMRVDYVESCELANGVTFTINFGDDQEAADEFVAMCETAQLQLLWYDNLVRWTAASCQQ